MIQYTAITAGMIAAICLVSYFVPRLLNRQPDEATPWRKVTDQEKQSTTPLGQVVAMPTVVRSLTQGWTYSYSDATRFVGADHPDGGRMSIAKLYPGPVGMCDEIGHAIASMLNAAQPLHEIRDAMDQAENQQQQKESKQ